MKGKIFSISVDLLSNGKINPSTIRVDNDLLDVLEPVASKKWFVDRITDIHNIDDLPAVIEDIILEMGSLNRPFHQITRNTAQLVISEIDEIGWDRFSGITEDLRSLKLCLLDNSHRSHEIELSFEDDYPDTPPVVRVSAPFEVALDWTWKRSISHVVDCISRDLNTFASYFTVDPFQLGNTSLA